MGNTPDSTRRAFTRSASLAALSVTVGFSGCLGGGAAPFGEEDPSPEPQVVNVESEPPIGDILPDDEVEVRVLVHNVGVGAGPVSVSTETAIGEDRVIDSASTELEMEGESQEAVYVNFTATASAERIDATAEAVED